LRRSLDIYTTLKDTGQLPEIHRERFELVVRDLKSCEGNPANGND
jgi:hypothetical protein